jgi:hypothetical protein
MKLYLSTLAITLMLLFIADTRITLLPFSISFARGWLALGIILIICGCICLKAQWYGEGLKKGAEIKEEVREEIKEPVKIKEVI